MQNLSALPGGFHRLPNDVNLGSGRRLHIKAAELDHLAGVQTFGYTVEEQTPPGNIDVEKTKALGVEPSGNKKYSLLKNGIAVQTDDGNGMVYPEQVLTATFRPRKFAFLADHRLVPRPMAYLCTGADVLVHEATLSIKDGIDKVKIRGHNNAYNAGQAGKEFGCKVVALNHFGSTSMGKEYVDAMVAEARKGNRNASKIIASYDFMELCVPRGGFDFIEVRATDRTEDTAQQTDEEENLPEANQEEESESEEEQESTEEATDLGLGSFCEKRLAEQS